MLRRSTIFLGLMLTGSLAAAALVSGEESQTGEIVAPVTGDKISRRAAADEAQPVLPVLQLEKLARAEASEPEQDPFAGKSWYVPPPPPPPAKVTVTEPPKPTAPPLPFGYMGRMQEEGSAAVVYLTQGTRAYSVKQGDTIDGTYRVDDISRTQVALTYLPLDIKQTLDIGGASAGMDQVASADSALSGAIPSAPLPAQVRDTESLPQ